MDKTLKILVIDDDEVDCMAVQRALKKANLPVEFQTAQSAESGLAVLQESAFDCIFLDYRLPDLDGLDLIKHLKLNQVDAPLIVLTGQGDERIAVEMMKAGASDYLSKSRLSSEILAQVLRNALRVHQAEKAVTLANQQLREKNERLQQKNQELEEQRQQIQRQNQQLKEISHLKSQFLATMSHELRTPINAIMGFSQLLLRQYPDPLTKTQVDMVQRMFNNSQNLLLLLNEVLDYSKIEAGQLNLKFNEFDLGQLVTATTEELRSLAVEKRLDLNLHINLFNPQVVTDQRCVQRVLTNLISNAIKFTDAGSVSVCASEVSCNRLLVAVKDTGMGIAPENLPHIFEAFRQADQTLKRQHAGTGLGLAIADSLVKKMQGTISVESQVGRGSVFRVEIPRQTVINQQ